MEALHWIVRKAIDFDIWFNKRVLGWDADKNFRWVMAGAQDDSVKEYIKSKFCK
jgi:hypothetical protein